MSLLNLATFRAAQLCRDPFDYLVVPGFLRAEGLAGIHADYPKVDRPGSFPLSEVTYGRAFGELIEELRGEAVREAFAEKFAVDLKNRPTMFTVRGQCWEKDGHIHTDSTTKIITILIYMNPRWEESGGRLRLLRSGTDLEDVVLEVPPDEGTLLCFRRSENSWHGHKTFVGPRRVIQMNWVTSQKVLRYESTRHRLSAVFKRIVLRAS
jgi:SM-20-related protein